MSIAVLFLLALLASAALVAVCRVAALRLGYVAAGRRPPDAPPKALFGGVGIALSVFGCAAAIGAFPAFPVLLLCTAALFLFGVASDVFAIKPAAKLLGIIAVASALLFFDYRLHWSPSLTLDSLATLFWIVGITSAFKVLDSMDGLCGSIALTAGAAFLLTLVPVPSEGTLLLEAQYLAIVLGAVAGFLVHNLHPASIALGDAGSLVIGLTMAAMPLEVAPGRSSDLLSIVAVPVLLLLIPIVDATLAALAGLAGRSAGRGAPVPSSHRLVAMGLSERKAVGLLWMLSAVSGAGAVIADRYPQVSVLLAAIFTIAVALFGVYLGRVRVHENVNPDQLPTAVTPLGIEPGYRRRLAEMMLDLMIVSVAYYGSHRLLYTADEWAENFTYFFDTFPMVLGTQMVAIFAAGVYRGTWRYFSLSDGLTAAKGVFVGVLASQALVVYLHPIDRYPPALFIMDAMLLFLLLVGSRTSFRLLSEFVQRQRQTGRRLLIYGAGDVGATAVRYLMAGGGGPYRIVGFIDDDPVKRNIRVHGYPVIGGFDHLVGLVLAGAVDAVAVTHDSPNTPGLTQLCASRGVGVYRIGIDWREISAAEPAAAGPALREPESRVVQFRGARRPAAAALELPRSAREPEPQRAPQTERVRVAHVITRLILGGAQENTLYTAIGQHRDARFDVTLVCGVDEAGEGNMFSEANAAGVRTVVLPSLVREIRPWTDLLALVDLYRFLRAGQFAVVHTHSSKAGIVGRLAARAAGVPVVVHTIHGVAFHEFQSQWKNRLYVALERLCAPASTRIISVSQRLTEAALKHGIGRAPQYTTIFSGIDLEAFLSVRDRLTPEAARQRLGIPPDAPVVGKIARLFDLKGHDQFLAAAAGIAREVPDVRFLLVGDGPLREALARRAQELGLGDRVVFVGRVPPETVPDYVQAMDVVVHTSLREGIARVLPQAGAVGKPVVTFHLDGAPEVVADGVSGYLVPPLDTAGIAARVVELLRDPDRRKAFGEAGRAFAAEHFSLDRMVGRISNLYLELLAERR